MQICSNGDIMIQVPVIVSKMSLFSKILILISVEESYYIYIPTLSA